MQQATLPSETYRIEGVGADGFTTYANDTMFSEVLVGPLNGGGGTTSDERTFTEQPPSSTVPMPPQTIHGELNKFSPVSAIGTDWALACDPLLATLVADAKHFVWSRELCAGREGRRGVRG